MHLRRGPRPLALHVAHAEWAWRSGNPARLTNFYRGVKAYRHHTYRRAKPSLPIIWERGECKIYGYGSESGWPVVVVPSLINRSYILDLMPGTSLLDDLSASGLRPFLIDWGNTSIAERQLSLDGFILERLEPAFDWIHRKTSLRPLVLGYCMGGTLALALACLRQSEIAGLALLAAPWDFSESGGSACPSRPHPQALAAWAGAIGSAPTDVLQAHFAELEPLSVPKKFSRFSDVEPRSRRALRFVAIEDWLNDGVPLGAEVAAGCLIDWYGRNAPARGAWCVNGEPVRPERLNLPVWLAIPERDRIVPPRSALMLASVLQDCVTLRPEGGHIGMIAGERARRDLWQPLTAWLGHIAALQKKNL